MTPVDPTPAAPDQAEGPLGILTGEDLAAIRKRAWDCDDEERKRRGKLPRSTRCHQCATILTLLAHIDFITPANEARHAVLL